VATEKLLAAQSQLDAEDLTLAEVAEAMRQSPVDPEDVEDYCLVDESTDECLARFQAEQDACDLAADAGFVPCDPDGKLLAAVRRCNVYDLGDFTPVLVEDEQVGWVNPTVFEALSFPLAVGRACELVEASDLTGAAKMAAERTVRRVAIRIAAGGWDEHFPLGPESRSEFMAALVDELVDDGIIPSAKLRNELQDVRPFSAGFVVAGEGETPALRMERAAMIYFGVPSYGTHINGWVRDPENPSSEKPWAMWVAVRSMSKATYPGLLDQMVAGGQPTAISFEENVRKECEEEASLPPEVIAAIKPAGSVSYRYATPKGLSTKMLMAYDSEMPQGLVPLCSDGEVEEFRLLRMDEVLRSLREDLPLWKPNSALVAIDFCVRHGLVDEKEPGYAELVQLLDQRLI
jgi:hypothetical protein